MQHRVCFDQIIVKAQMTPGSESATYTLVGRQCCKHLWPRAAPVSCPPFCPMLPNVAPSPSFCRAFYPLSGFAKCAVCPGARSSHTLVIDCSFTIWCSTCTMYNVRSNCLNHFGNGIWCFSYWSYTSSVQNEK